MWSLQSSLQRGINEKERVEFELAILGVARPTDVEILLQVELNGRRAGDVDVRFVQRVRDFPL